MPFPIAMCAVACAAVVLLSSSDVLAGPASVAGSASIAGPAARLFEAMRAAVHGWQVVAQEYARGLFMVLAGINLSWVGVEILTAGGHDIRAAVLRLARELFVMSIWYAFIALGPEVALELVRFFERAGQEAQGSGLITTQQIVDKTLELSVQLFKDHAGMLFDFEAMWMGLCTILMVLLVAFIGLVMWVVEFFTYLTIGLGAIVLGAGGCIWTRSLVSNYLKFAAGSGLALFFMRFTQGFVLTSIAAWTTEASSPSSLGAFVGLDAVKGVGPETMLTMLLTLVILAGLVVLAPALGLGLLGGGLSNIANNVGSAAMRGMQLSGAGGGVSRVAGAAAGGIKGASAKIAGALGRSGSGASMLASTGGAAPSSPSAAGAQGGGGAARVAGGGGAGGGDAGSAAANVNGAPAEGSAAPAGEAQQARAADGSEGGAASNSASSADRGAGAGGAGKGPASAGASVGTQQSGGTAGAPQSSGRGGAGGTGTGSVLAGAAGSRASLGGAGAPVAWVADGVSGGASPSTAGAKQAAVSSGAAEGSAPAEASAAGAAGPTTAGAGAGSASRPTSSGNSSISSSTRSGAATPPALAPSVPSSGSRHGVASEGSKGVGGGQVALQSSSSAPAPATRAVSVTPTQGPPALGSSRPNGEGPSSAASAGALPAAPGGSGAPRVATGGVAVKARTPRTDNARNGGSRE